MTYVVTINWSPSRYFWFKCSSEGHCKGWGGGKGTSVVGPRTSGEGNLRSVGLDTFGYPKGDLDQKRVIVGVTQRWNGRIQWYTTWILIGIRV